MLDNIIDMMIILPPTKSLILKVSLPVTTDKRAVTTEENGIIIATVLGLMRFTAFVLIIQHKAPVITTKIIVATRSSGLKEK